MATSTHSNDESNLSNVIDDCTLQPGPASLSHTRIVNHDHCMFTVQTVAVYDLCD